MHPLVALVEKDLETDIEQMAEEGHDPLRLRRELERARAQGTVDALLALQESLWSRPSPAGFACDEPDEWNDIVAACGMSEAENAFDGDREALRDRVHAAWLGRCVGCQAGKPIEGLTRPDRIKELLRRVGSWPLEDYMNPMPDDMEIVLEGGAVFFDAATDWRNAICRGNFDHAANDDDINYAIVSQLLVEELGTDFSSEQALAHFLRVMPRYGLYASGKNMYEKAAFGVPWQYTGIFGNPCRQSLGAQIRCDAFGWAAPGRPVRAARMAYRDAYNSQRRNGIYSGMFFAALLADVLAHGDVGRAIETASTVIPPRSRFAGMVRFVKAQCAEASDWETVDRALIERYPAESKRFNHAIPNAGIVVMSLLLGGGDFTRTVGISVMAGLDTDCNGATAGSIMGAALGTAGIPSHWTEPLNDRIESHVRGHQRVRISALAQRMFDTAVKRM